MSSISTRLPVHVSPGARRNELIEFRDGTLFVRIAAPPVQGKANQELLSFLSGQLGVSKSSLSVLKGHTSRHKVIGIDHLRPEEVMARLKNVPSSSSFGDTSSPHPG